MNTFFPPMEHTSDLCRGIRYTHAYIPVAV